MPISKLKTLHIGCLNFMVFVSKAKWRLNKRHIGIELRNLARSVQGSQIPCHIFFKSTHPKWRRDSPRTLSNESIVLVLLSQQIFFTFLARRPRNFQLGWAKLSNTSQTQTCRNLDYAVIGKPICANDLHIMIENLHGKNCHGLAQGRGIIRGPNWFPKRNMISLGEWGSLSLYLKAVRFLTPYRRVLNNWRMFDLHDYRQNRQVCLLFKIILWEV